MKKIFTYLGLAMLFLLPTTMHAEDYLMPQYGYETKTVSKDAPLTFYDFKGADASFTQSAFSTVIFQPATEGYSIQITFEELELVKYSASYDVYMRIYNGAFDTESVTYISSGNPGTNSTFPETANQIAYIPGDGAVNPLPTYVSASSDGKLSVCLYSKDPSPKASHWKAIVTEVKLEEMTVKSAAANYDFVDTQAWVGKQGVAFAGLTVTTEGYSSPDKLQKLTFTVEQTAVIDPTTLQLYAGQSATAAGMTALAGTVTEESGTYTYTLTEPYALSNGDNKFMLAGDVLSTADFNATAKVNLTGITTAGGFSTFTTATPAEVKVAAMYLMSENATYSINQETLFYDDGGKDGKRSNSFTGTVTFLPTTEGKKIQIDFKSIGLFYNSSAVGVGNQDVLKIYNGTTATEANLLYTVEADKTTNLILKSTSTDGALTVYLATKTPSESYMGDGWEAVVSEFTPLAMTVSGSELQKTAPTVSAAATDVQYIGFNLKTQDTEPALQAKTFALTTNNTYQLLKAAKVYYTGVSSTFTKTTQVAAADITANELTITAETPLALREGDNWFWVAVDIADRAATNSVAELQLLKVGFADGTEYTTFDNPTEQITIKNIVYSTEGTKTVDVFGEWEFTHTLYNEYSENYNVGTTDQITIFRPTTAGRVVQMDFKDFEVYYSYYKAKFEIYDGEGTSGTKLFEVTSSNIAGANPGTFRSTTGALTVVFNPNTSSSNYIAKGWHATVYEYELQNMSLETISVEQASTRLVKLGEQKAEILTLDIQTLGTLNPLTLNEVTVNLKGSEQNVSKVYLLQGETVLAEAAAAASITLTLATPQELKEYSNLFTLAFDIKDDATVDQTVDAAVTSLKLGETMQTVTNGDPEGSRLIKNVMNLAAGDNGTVTIGSTSLMFYDDGGADDKYTSKIEGYVTFVPAHEGYAVEVVVNNYKLSSGAPVNIYYGRSHEGTADATVEYNYSDPEKYKGLSFISSAEDGSLTIYFKDGGWSVNDGWEFEIREHLLTNLAIEKVEATSIASALQTVGAKDLRMLQIAITVAGDRTPITIDEINLNKNENVEAIKIYQTDKIAAFASTTEFAAPYTISERGNYYFWVTADASTTADDDDVVEVTLVSVKSGEQLIEPATAEKAQTKLAHGMRGVYYIGESTAAEPTDFPTVASALEALDILGIEGSVTFNIVPGNYTEQATLVEIKGASADATITFQSSTGNAADVIFTSNNTSDTQGVWTIDGTDYLTLKNLTFKSDKDGYAAVLVFKNQSQHCTIDGCVLSTSIQSNNTSQNMQLVRLINEDSDNSNCSYFTLQNSTLTGGYIGVTLSQGAYATHPNQTDIKILNNTFTGQEKYMISGTMLKDVTISGNTMTQTSFTQADFRAIDLGTKIEGTFTIANNNIVLNGSNYANAIYLGPTSATNCAEGTVANIYNNAISVTGETTSITSAIQLRYMREVNLTYNTLFVNASGSNCAPLVIYYGANLTLTATNNIFQNIGTGYAIYYSSANFAKGTYSHNAFYSESGNFASVGSATDYTAWQALENITASDNIVEKAVFASNTLLLLKEAGSLVSATPVATITTDITGKTRAATPTIGAYEYDPSFFVIPTVAEGYPKIQNIEDTQADIVVKTNNLGTAKVLVLAADAPAPAVAEVLASESEITLRKDEETIFKLTGLTEETTYIAYIVTLSPLGDAADALTPTESFTTAWTLRPVQLKPVLTQIVAENTAVALTAEILTEYNQAKPYSYLWYTAYSTTSLSTEATLNITATQTTEYICKVTDQFGQTAYLTATVQVAGESKVAGFEEYDLAEGKNKYVDDAWENQTPAWLYSGTYQFANTPNKAYNAYTGYAISADNSAEATGNYMTDQFRSAAGGAYEGSNFAVSYYSAPNAWFAGYADTVRLTNTSEPQQISGFYITNTAYTQDAVLNGDYANPRFGIKDSTNAVQKDYLKLTISGYNGDEFTGSVDFYLADYRDDDSDEHYSLDTWQWLDLREVGAVTELQFEMFTTKSDDHGFTTPTYFALDNFGGKMPVDTLEAFVLSGNSATISLGQYFTHEEKGKVVYSIVDEQTHDMTCQISGNQLEVVASAQSASAGVTIRQTQRGKQQYKYLPLRKDTYTATDHAEDQISVFPTLLTDRLHVNADSESCMIQVFAADGRMMTTVEGAQFNSLPTSAWAQGHYLVRVTTARSTIVVPVIKK